MFNAVKIFIFLHLYRIHVVDGKYRLIASGAEKGKVHCKRAVSRGAGGLVAIDAGHKTFMFALALQDIFALRRADAGYLFIGKRGKFKCGGLGYAIRNDGSNVYIVHLL